MKHLDQKYFSFRSSVVAAAQARYPDRRRVLFVSEVLRLGFFFIGTALCCVLSSVLALLIVPRYGILEWRSVTVLMMAALPFAICVRVATSAFAVVTSRRRNVP